MMIKNTFIQVLLCWLVVVFTIMGMGKVIKGEDNITDPHPNIILKEWIIAQADCGEKIPDLIIYEQVSQYSTLSFLPLHEGHFTFFEEPFIRNPEEL